MSNYICHKCGVEVIDPSDMEREIKALRAELQSARSEIEELTAALHGFEYSVESCIGAISHDQAYRVKDWLQETLDANADILRKSKHSEGG